MDNRGQVSFPDPQGERGLGVLHSPAAGGLRRPLYVVAIVAVLLVVLIETGSHFWVDDPVTTNFLQAAAEAYEDIPEDMARTLAGAPAPPPGAGIGALALVDGLLLFTVLMWGLSLIVPQRVFGRIQGAIVFIVSLLWIIMSALLSVVALAKLMLMIGLFVSTPFGTIAYLAIWGGFPAGRAAVILALLLLLKVAFGVFLVLAQLRFLMMKGLILLVVVSAVLQLVLVFIHGLLPGPIIAIGDQLWSIVTGVVALVWAVVMLIGAIPAIINAIRVTGSVAD